MRTDYFRVVTLVAAMAAAAVVAVMMALGTAGMAFAAPCDPSACGADGWPTVVKTVPRDGAKGVDRDKSIKVTFSEAMNPASINDRSVELLWFDSECTFACSAGNKVPATVSYDANARTATLDPDERLTKRRLYYIVVWSAGDDQALDDDGSSMEFTYVGSFKTGRR